MGKGISRFYKNSQWKWPYPSPNTIFVVPPCSDFLPQSDITNYWSADIITRNQPSPISNLTTTNQVDTGVNNDDDTKSFVTSRKHYHRTPEICDKNITTNQVQPNLNSRPYQRSLSTPTTSFKLSSSGKEYICFQIYG